ncbi:MAG: hypothetical protein Q8M65_04435 [Rhodoglobus sp.]|nr:hypothetical protein [Rhodoglobus sp.]
MSLLSDALLIAALDAQYRRLDELISRLELAKATLIPPPANFWLGSARLAYDSAMSGLAVTVDGGIAALRSAFELTGAASSEVRARA